MGEFKGLKGNASLRSLFFSSLGTQECVNVTYFLVLLPECRHLRAKRLYSYFFIYFISLVRKGKEGDGQGGIDTPGVEYSTGFPGFN